jgi:hypothetical protein
MTERRSTGFYTVYSRAGEQYAVDGHTVFTKAEASEHAAAINGHAVPCQLVGLASVASTDLSDAAYRQRRGGWGTGPQPDPAEAVARPGHPVTYRDAIGGNLTDQAARYADLAQRDLLAKSIAIRKAREARCGPQRPCGLVLLVLRLHQGLEPTCGRRVSLQRGARVTRRLRRGPTLHRYLTGGLAEQERQ